MSLPATHKAVVLYPPGYDIRVETLPTPKIEHPDDAIVKVKVAGLCGSDLHQYRYHDRFENPFVTGHEFAGEVVALGSSYGPNAAGSGRPSLYSTLKEGDKVVATFSTSCCECHFCRMGFTSRCESSLLFGSQLLPGAQAQYVRVPKAGGTLFKIPPGHATTTEEIARWNSISDASLLLLADILPTGVFAVTQALQHPNILPILNSKPFPTSSFAQGSTIEQSSTALLTEDLPPLTDADKRLTIAIIGLGPVGLCAVVSLLDQLASKGLRGTRVIAIDLSESRRAKIAKVVEKLGGVPGNGIFRTATIEEGKKIVADWTGGLGCNTALEIVGHNDALQLAYDLIRPFGVICSVGVHQMEPVGITGRFLYNKNVSLIFGRCPVRAIFPFALQLLLKRQDIFAGIGEDTSLIDKVVGLDDESAKESYRKFEKGLCGKVLFEPWR
ncbi:chaperonin 10-like protein [Gautieria morchelliformis]|nr:chaperonin 10-like protein [Gautieria morchelliformis]